MNNNSLLSGCHLSLHSRLYLDVVRGVFAFTGRFCLGIDTQTRWLVLKITSMWWRTVSAWSALHRCPVWVFWYQTNGQMAVRRIRICDKWCHRFISEAELTKVCERELTREENKENKYETLSFLHVQCYIKITITSILPNLPSSVVVDRHSYLPLWCVFIHFYLFFITGAISGYNNALYCCIFTITTSRHCGIPFSFAYMTYSLISYIKGDREWEKNALTITLIEKVFSQP